MVATVGWLGTDRTQESGSAWAKNKATRASASVQQKTLPFALEPHGGPGDNWKQLIAT